MSPWIISLTRSPREEYEELESSYASLSLPLQKIKDMSFTGLNLHDTLGTKWNFSHLSVGSDSFPSSSKGPAIDSTNPELPSYTL